jgi:hypothetical protein
MPQGCIFEFVIS